MILIGDVYQLVCDLLSKNNGVYISPQEFTRYANVANYQMFDDYCGIKTTPRVTYGKNRLVDERLNPFRRRASLTFASGVATKPTNLKHITAVYTADAIPIAVKPTDEDRYANLFSDPLASPNAQDKYYIETETSLRLLGETSLSAWIEYLERPVAVVYGTIEVNGRPVYNPSTSVHFQWDVSETIEITNRILLQAGLSMKDIAAMNYSNNEIAKE